MKKRKKNLSELLRTLTHKRFHRLSIQWNYPIRPERAAIQTNATFLITTKKEKTAGQSITETRKDRE
jgi:hypothetical protein